jgi:hypothetical protein
MSRNDGCLLAVLIVMGMILAAIYLVADHPEWGR